MGLTLKGQMKYETSGVSKRCGVETRRKNYF